MLAIALKPFGVRSLVGLMKLPAALLTRPVSGPLSSQMRCTIASTAAASRMSTAWVRTPPPPRPASSSFAVFSSTAARRPQSQSSAPRARYLAAISLPRPVPPPVTRMRLPLRRPSLNMGAPSPRQRSAYSNCSDQRRDEPPHDLSAFALRLRQHDVRQLRVTLQSLVGEPYRYHDLPACGG